VNAKTDQNAKSGPATSLSAAGRKHWHGATATTAMSHIAVRKRSTARSSTGWKKVSDDDYLAPVTSDNGRP
jgi:hypothetical protein